MIVTITVTDAQQRDVDHQTTNLKHRSNDVNHIFSTRNGVNDIWRSGNVGISMFDGTEKRIFRVEERTGDVIQRALNEAAAAAAAAVSNEEELKL